MTATSTIAPGAHIVVRDAVWRVLQVNRTSNGRAAWNVVGVSDIVRDQDAIFLEEYEPSVEVLDPAETALEVDTSPGHRSSLLHMEALLRDVPPTGPELHVGHRAAMDVLEFQLKPAVQSLERPRQRILIADAVGLGKTLEAGILLAELIRRGRGRRILVATVKSMLAQFQKELWARFAIPLVRLDSLGLQRIKQHIPTNHNPFYFFDKVIISIDTLKQDNAFKTHVERAWWDVVVIDEAHNVAVRGGRRSRRSKIAETLAERSDALIMLSATPHDGKAPSFASLMNMLDPTAIADPEHYTRDDIEGLFVRRFKKDVAAELGKAFPKREIRKAWAQASPAEEKVFEQLTGMELTWLGSVRSGGMLYRTGLEKALFSSPSACDLQLLAPLRRETVRKHLPDDFFPGRGEEEKRKPSEILTESLEHLPGHMRDDIATLASLARAIEGIGASSFSKYGKLLQVIRKNLGWKVRRAKRDRLVIFSERIETLRFLAEHLPRDLQLKDGQVEVLHGGLSDVEQMRIVEEFGKETAKVRLLLASDVAAEGINLHYLCHKLVHFDVPWSLMVFQQRNGRIDRYGQERPPAIVYMLTDSTNEDIRGDNRVLELLMLRDQQATENIDDPSALLGVYDIEEQELITAEAMEQGLEGSRLDDKLAGDAFLDPLEAMLRMDEEDDEPLPTRDPVSLFRTDLDYVALALDHLAEIERVRSTVSRDDRLVELVMPPELVRRYRKLPPEILPKDRVLLLTSDADTMQRAMADARREEDVWPRHQYLWPLHPVVGWCNDKARSIFKRHTAPVLTLLDGLDPDEAVVVVSGLVPNRRAQPLVHRWFAARFRGGLFERLEPFEALVERLRLGSAPLPNRQAPVDLEALRELIPEAVRHTREEIVQVRDEFESRLNDQLDVELSRLETLRDQHVEQLELRFEGQAHRLDPALRRVNRMFDRFLEWVQESMTTEPHPFLQVIAVLRSERGFGGEA